VARTVVCIDEFDRSIRHLVRPSMGGPRRGRPIQLHSHCPSFDSSWATCDLNCTRATPAARPRKTKDLPESCHCLRLPARDQFRQLCSPTSAPPLDEKAHPGERLAANNVELGLPELPIELLDGRGSGALRHNSAAFFGAAMVGDAASTYELKGALMGYCASARTTTVGRWELRRSERRLMWRTLRRGERR
jgi:hypothetical protein